ncbi:MAG: glycosyl transferase [Candidatus Rokuibacteriota bacterium]|nr:MAG: glycosyl transferase [Candidatus Rokubacteria bacterium]
MRILFVTNMYPTPERPGYGAFVRQQAEQLRRFGHTVDVINILGFRSRLNYLRGALDVLRTTRTTPYDVVHAHYGLTALPAWFRLHAPLVMTLHGSDVLGGRLERLCSRFMSRLADSVIVVSEEMRRVIPGIVIPCGVDLDLFRPFDRDEARTRLGWPSDKYLILFPFDPRRRVKRYDLARAAVDRLTKEGIAVELITVFGVDNREMPWHYSAADAMLLCSDSEGSPTSVKEALACDLPVVATDVGDVREILRGVPGTGICTRDVGDIAGSLREALTVSRTGRFERRAAMAKYNQALTVAKIIDVYNTVLAGCTAKRSLRMNPGRPSL